MPRRCRSWHRVVTELTDDTDGKPADEAVTFALDGQEYEIDLTAKNAAALRMASSLHQERPRIDGRRSRSSSSARSSSSPSKGDVNTKAVREWAGKNGYQLSVRSRIPANVIEAYQAAQR